MMMRKYQVTNIKRVIVYMYTSAPKRIMIVFASEKKKKPEPRPVESSSGKVFTRKPPLEPDMGSPIPFIIQPTDEGAYQLPA